MPFEFDENLKQSLEKIFPERVREPHSNDNEEHFIQIKTPTGYRNIHYELHVRINKITRKKVGRYELHFEGRAIKNKKTVESRVIKKIVHAIEQNNSLHIGAKDCSVISKNIYQYRFWLDKDIESFDSPEAEKDLRDFVAFFDKLFLSLIEEGCFTKTSADYD